MRRSNNPPHHDARERLYLHFIPCLALNRFNALPLNVFPLSERINFGIPRRAINFLWLRKYAAVVWSGRISKCIILDDAQVVMLMYFLVICLLLGCTLVQTGPHRSTPVALNARPPTTLNSRRSLTAVDGYGNLSNFLHNKHLLRILLTVCLPSGIQYFDCISNRASLTPLWYTFSPALYTTKSVKWWELRSSIGSFVSNGNFPLPNQH